MPVGFFYFECFRFYHQLRFLFRDSHAEPDGSPHPPSVWLAQQSLAAFARGLMLKCCRVCQGDADTSVALSWGVHSGILEYQAVL